MFQRKPDHSGDSHRERRQTATPPYPPLRARL